MTGKDKACRDKASPAMATRDKASGIQASDDKASGIQASGIQASDQNSVFPCQIPKQCVSVSDTQTVVFPCQIPKQWYFPVRYPNSGISLTMQ